MNRRKVCLIISFEIASCGAHIVENTDDSNRNRNDNSNGNITLSNCFRLINISETFTIEGQQRKFNNSILQLKDLIDQAQKLLHSSQINVNVVLNPVPTVFDLYVDNYLQNHNSQNYSWKKGKPEL